MSYEQTGNALTFYAFFVASAVGATGLTVTVDIYKNGSSLSTANAATAVGGGLYSYTLSSGSVDAEGMYAAIFKTSGTADQKHIPSLWVVGKGGVEYLDATVSSRNATTPPTVAAIRGEMDANSTRLDAAVSTRATPAQVTTIVAAISGGGGSVEYTENVTDDSDDPLDGVSVTVRTTTDSTDVPTASGTTDAFGNVTFMLDPGTYYVWAQRAGHNFTNPSTIVVTA
jgi:hypothetical protein